MTDKSNEIKKNDLLALTIGSSKAKERKKFSIDKAEFEMVKPTIAERKEIARLADKEDNITDLDSLAVWGIIKLTYHPGTDDRVYDDSHYKEFFDFPADAHWFTILVDNFYEFAWAIKSQEEQEADKGNLKGTSSAD